MTISLGILKPEFPVPSRNCNDNHPISKMFQNQIHIKNAQTNSEIICCGWCNLTSQGCLCIRKSRMLDKDTLKIITLYENSPKASARLSSEPIIIATQRYVSFFGSPCIKFHLRRGTKPRNAQEKYKRVNEEKKGMLVMPWWMRVILLDTSRWFLVSRNCLWIVQRLLMWFNVLLGRDDCSDAKSQDSVTCETNAPLWISKDMSRQQKETIATLPRWCGQITRW